MLLAIALAACACFDFEAPIDPIPRHALDPALLGVWRCLPADAKPDATPANFVVAAARERVYSIRFGEGDEKPEVYEAHASQINGHTLLNVRDMDTRFPSKPWAFARYSFLLPHVLRVELVNEDALESVEHSPPALRAAIERLDGTTALYEDYCVCVRARVEPK